MTDWSEHSVALCVANVNLMTFKLSIHMPYLIERHLHNHNTSINTLQLMKCSKLYYVQP